MKEVNTKVLKGQTQGCEVTIIIESPLELTPEKIKQVMRSLGDYGNLTVVLPPVPSCAVKQEMEKSDGRNI